MWRSSGSFSVSIDPSPFGEKDLTPRPKSSSWAGPESSPRLRLSRSGMPSAGTFGVAWKPRGVGCISSSASGAPACSLEFCPRVIARLGGHGRTRPAGEVGHAAARRISHRWLSSDVATPGDLPLRVVADPGGHQARGPTQRHAGSNSAYRYRQRRLAQGVAGGPSRARPIQYLRARTGPLMRAQLPLLVWGRTHAVSALASDTRHSLSSGRSPSSCVAQAGKLGGKIAERGSLHDCGT